MDSVSRAFLFPTSCSLPSTKPSSGQKRCVASFDDTFGQKRYHERQASLRRSSSISVGAELDGASTRKLEINRGRHRETQNARSFVPLVNNFQIARNCPFKCGSAVPEKQASPLQDGGVKEGGSERVASNWEKKEKNRGRE